MKTSSILMALIIGAGIGYAIGSLTKQKSKLSDLPLSELNTKLEKLVEIEDYETACIVRDVIKSKTK